MDKVSVPAILIAAVPVATAFIAGFWAWAQGRKKGGADVQGVINAGFAELVKKLQEERVELSKVIDKQAADIVGLRAKLVEMEDKLDELLKRWRRGEQPPTPENRP